MKHPLDTLDWCYSVSLSSQLSWIDLGSCNKQVCDIAKRRMGSSDGSRNPVNAGTMDIRATEITKRYSTTTKGRAGLNQSASEP